MPLFDRKQLFNPSSHVPPDVYLVVGRHQPAAVPAPVVLHAPDPGMKKEVAHEIVGLLCAKRYLPRAFAKQVFFRTVLAALVKHSRTWSFLSLKSTMHFFPAAKMSTISPQALQLARTFTKYFLYNNSLCEDSKVD